MLVQKEYKSNYTILIVDDSSRDRALCRNLLKQDYRYSYEVIEAGANTQPLTLLQQALPDLILLSASSSHLENILEILSYLKLQGKGMRIPVILLTEQENHGLSNEAIRRGADDCLGKSTLNSSILTRTVQNVIERSRLIQQLEQTQNEQKLVWEIASRIRCSLNLEEVLQAVVNEVRQLLKADRVVVFRFSPDMSGKIVAESILPEWSSTLDAEIVDTCLQENAGELYCQGWKSEIANIYEAGLTECHIQLLEQFQVQANLVVPILLFEGIESNSDSSDAQLWGLLIAHQCSAPRQWQSSELNLLDQLAGQISIAIQQATALERAQTEIVERRKAEEEIQRSRNFLQTMIDYLPVAVSVKAAENNFGTFELWNRASERLFGFTAKDVLGKTDYDLFSTQQADYFREKDQEVIAQGRPLESPKESIYCQNLGQRLLHTITVPVQNESNEPEYLLCIAEDVTDRQKAQIDLEKREQLLTALVEIQQKLLDLERDESAYVKVLELLGVASGATRISIYEKHQERRFTTIRQRVKWCAENNQIEVASAEACEISDRPLPSRWINLLEAGELVSGYRNRFFESEQVFLVTQNIFSILLIPLVVEGEFFGFVRLDQHQEGVVWEALEVDFMRAAVFAISLTLEQSRAAIALAKSQSQFAALAAAAPVGIFRTDVKGHCIYVNDRFCEISGVTVEDALGIGWSRALHPQDRHPILSIWGQAINQQKAFFAEYRFQRANGSIVWVCGQAVTEHDKQGKVIGYIGTIGDITNCKEAEASLQQLNVDLEQRVEERTLELTQANQRLTQEIIEHQKTESALSLRVERLNKLYSLVIALNKATTIDEIYTIALNGMRQVLKTNRIALLVPDEHGIPRYQSSIGISGAYRSAVEDYLTASQQQINAKTVIISDAEGEEGDELLDSMRQAEGIKASASFPLRYKGEHLGKIVVYYDTPHQFTAEEIKLAKTIITYVATAITRKRGEEAIQQTNDRLAIMNAELARATRLKDEFLANMSHELRTPLNAILGMSDGLLDEMYGSLNDRQKRSLSIIERSGRHLLELINDILDLAKIESGKLELQFSSVALHDLCESSLTFVRQMAITKGIQLITKISEDAGKIQVDDRRIRQALINLLSNAVKFTEENGKVTLEAQIDLATQSVYFTVTDTGIGIAPENIEKLFQAFVQIDSNLDRQYSGTGLGLALVRQIVELHNGEITVESQVGLGSQFKIRLPYTEPQPEKIPTRDISSKPSTSTSAVSSPESSLILLAEDNEANTIVFSDYLTDHGYQLVIAKDGFQAVQLAKTHQPHLILMDIQMPGMDGLTAIRQIRADQILSTIPIIALTALAMPGDRERCLATGANQYIAKPVRLKELAEVVQQFVRN